MEAEDQAFLPSPLKVEGQEQGPDSQTLQDRAAALRVLSLHRFHLCPLIILRICSVPSPCPSYAECPIGLAHRSPSIQRLANGALGLLGSWVSK